MDREEKVVTICAGERSCAAGLRCFDLEVASDHASTATS